MEMELLHLTALARLDRFIICLLIKRNTMLMLCCQDRQQRAVELIHTLYNLMQIHLIQVMGYQSAQEHQ